MYFIPFTVRAVKQAACEWANFCLHLFCLCKNKNAIKLRNTCQVWTIFQCFCELFHSSNSIGELIEETFSHKASIWFIEIESFLMAFFASFFFILQRIEKFTILQLKSFHEVLHLNWWSILFSTFPFFLAETNVNYISTALLYPRSTNCSGWNS